jgi:1-acyl-sn-glycerol-3-phosphate acyltransferase
MWRPRNDCGAACLPPSVVPRAHRTKLVALTAVLLAAAVCLPFAPGRIQFWARVILRVCGVRLSVRGRLPRRRALIVANHVSWLDIVAILAVSPSRILAKHEVGRWPLIGVLARSIGTIFVDRSRPRTLPATVADVAAALRTGATVAVFPEGTTGCGAEVGPFRPAMFQAAIDAGAIVVPVTLRYSDGAAAFLGEESLYASLRRVLARPALAITVIASSALYPGDGATRRDLATMSRLAVSTPRRLGLAA